MDAQSQSEHPIEKGISRRKLAQVLAAGAVAATAGTPAFAQQQTSSMLVMAIAKTKLRCLAVCFTKLEYVPSIC